jgi:hypothetical protein
MEVAGNRWGASDALTMLFPASSTLFLDSTEIILSFVLDVFPAGNRGMDWLILVLQPKLNVHLAGALLS